MTQLKVRFRWWWSELARSWSAFCRLAIRYCLKEYFSACFSHSRWLCCSHQCGSAAELTAQLRLVPHRWCWLWAARGSVVALFSERVSRQNTSRRRHRRAECVLECDSSIQVPSCWLSDFLVLPEWGTRPSILVWLGGLRTAVGSVVCARCPGSKASAGNCPGWTHCRRLRLPFGTPPRTDLCSAGRQRPSVLHSCWAVGWAWASDQLKTKILSPPALCHQTIAYQILYSILLEFLNLIFRRVSPDALTDGLQWRNSACSRSPCTGMASKRPRSSLTGLKK